MRPVKVRVSIVVVVWEVILGAVKWFKKENNDMLLEAALLFVNIYKDLGNFLALLGREEKLF